MDPEIKEEKIKTEGYRLFVEENGKVVGKAYIYLIPNENRDNMKYALMGEVMVDESMRGKGIGTKLVNRVISKARELGCYKLIATSRFPREHVHKLYEKYGYQKHGYEFRMNLIEVEEQN